jgi:SAM-dependent methyltransferase
MSILRSILPEKLYHALRKNYQRFNLRHISADDKYQQKTHREIFSEIYDNGLWAHGKEARYLEKNAKYFSGSGSYNKSSREYIQFITEYIKAYDIRSVTDIGCGDFNIGKQLCGQNPQIAYNGVDVVPNMIRHHNEKFRSERISFYCLNTLKDKVPPADLLLIRQVLQHLSNGDIIRLTSNCFPGFKHILVTEHQPKPEYLIKANIEKSSGPNTRVGSMTGSGVYLNKTPFTYKWQRLLSAEDDNPHTQINTYRIVG